MNRRRMQGLLLLGACALLLGVSLAFGWQERQTVMGVSIMSERSYDSLKEYVYEDLAEYITQNGQIAAIDQKENTIYISLDAQAHKEVWNIPITLKLHHPGYRLYFAPDAAFDDIGQAVRSGHKFTLIASAPTHHMRYQVVFTSLPVIRLQTESIQEENEGSLCLWSDYPADEGYYCVSASRARWHKRGGISRMALKTSYKVTLENRSGANNNMALLDMGKDDDWILNAMAKEDLKIREMTITRLWNELQETASYQLSMSPCRYVEVVADGKYMGLYMLQRRVDNKLLGAQYEQAVLFKGDTSNLQEPVQTALMLRSNPKQEPVEKLYEYILPFYRLIGTSDPQYDVLRLDEENWLDLNVFCSIFGLGDNAGSKNIYLIRDEKDGEEILRFLLWDTDMSMGLGWRNDDVRYAPEKANRYVDLRREAEGRFARDRSIYSAYVDQYTHLRSTLLSQENIIKKVLECHEEITASGALQRDQETWGLHNNGEDTLERLIELIRVRTDWLDETYLKAE